MHASMNLPRSAIEAAVGSNKLPSASKYLRWVPHSYTNAELKAINDDVIRTINTDHCYNMLNSIIRDMSGIYFIALDIEVMLALTKRIHRYVGNNDGQSLVACTIYHEIDGVPAPVICTVAPGNNDIISDEFIIESLYHELVHAVQFRSGRITMLENGNVAWDGKEYEHDDNTFTGRGDMNTYHAYPWEVEAYALERFNTHLEGVIPDLTEEYSKMEPTAGVSFDELIKRENLPYQRNDS